mgnify:CR=1 FL=1
MSLKNSVVAFLVVAAGVPALAQPWPAWPWNTPQPLHQEYRTTRSIVNYGPSPGSVVTVGQPKIEANFHGPVKKVRMWVNETEVTDESLISQDSITWVPANALPDGQHIVQIFGFNSVGLPVSGNWTFIIDTRISSTH